MSANVSLLCDSHNLDLLNYLRKYIFLFLQNVIALTKKSNNNLNWFKKIVKVKIELFDIFMKQSPKK